MKSFVLDIEGEVQGVGFRPWVAKLAKKYNFYGQVYNKTDGVVIELECTDNVLQNFKLALLGSSNPGVVSNLCISESPAKNFKYFQISDSVLKNKSGGYYPLIPDRKICQSCCNEMFTQDNRRYLYPFITCAACGPRFSITTSLPYDRKNTTMAKFNLCLDCQDEYQDINNIRYHAQTISCAKCGPELRFIKFNNNDIDNNCMESVVSVINSGQIIAIKGIGGYHLVCDATNDAAVNKIRELKNRKSKPFAIMCKNIEMVKDYCDFNNVEDKILHSNSAPIVLLNKKSKDIYVNKLSPSLAPGLSELGVFLPYTGLHFLLLYYFNRPLVMTSANLPDNPIAFTLDEVYKQFSNIIYGVLTDNRDINFPCDDSVIRVINNQATFIRRARGYSLQLTNNEWKRNSICNDNYIAVGAQMKNTIAIKHADRFYLSPYIGDMASIEYIKRFDYYKNNLIKLLNLDSNIKYIADKHPLYEVNKYLDSKNIIYRTVQHHKAHAYASLFEYPELSKAYIMVWDGTGLGDDNNIWGGEGFIYENKKLTRNSSLQQFKLLGGEQAIKEPKRIALSLLWHVYGIEREELPELWGNWINENFTNIEITIYRKMWVNNINTVLTSSMGRLFDGIASLLNICHVNDFDGHAPMLLESVATEYKSSQVLPVFIETILDFEFNLINWRNLIIFIHDLLRKKIPINNIAWQVHNIFSNLVISILQKNNVNNLLLTGGVFQNKLLTELIIAKANERQILVYPPKEISVNDSGLAVGQIYNYLLT